MLIISKYNFLPNFRPFKRENVELFTKMCNLGNSGAFFGPKKCHWGNTQSFPKYNTHHIWRKSPRCNFLESFMKIWWLHFKLWAKKCHFWPFWGFLPLFWPLGQHLVFAKINLLQCTTRPENTTCGKISEKSHGRLSSYSPDASTDGRTSLKTMVPLR